jgi:hypothetical protein
MNPIIQQIRSSVLRHRTAVSIWGMPRTHGMEGHNHASRRR